MSRELRGILKKENLQNKVTAPKSHIQPHQTIFFIKRYNSNRGSVTDPKHVLKMLYRHITEMRFVLYRVKSTQASLLFKISKSWLVIEK